MSEEEQINLLCNQLIGLGNLDVIGKIFLPSYIAHTGDKNYKGHEFIKRFSRQIHSAIPDIKVLKVEFLAKADNTITWQRTLGGTHKLEMMGIPPSERKVKWIEMVVTRFENGKIAEEWVVSELAGELLLKLPSK